MMLNSHITLLFSFLWQFSSAQLTTDWDYGRRGPDVWPQISSMCAGVSQSPINIRKSRATYEASLRPLSLDSYITNGSIYTWNFTHNGHTIVVYPSGSTSLSIDGANLNETFYLMDFRLHWGLNVRQGSEHTIDGMKYPLEIQFTHRALFSRSTLILSVLFDNQANENPYLNDFLKIVNETTNPSVSSIETLDLSSFFPTSTNPHYFLYQGSLTTPPCTEGITWIVLERTVPISNSQLEVFFTNSVPSNFRSPQNLNERQIFTNAQHHSGETGGGGHGQEGHGSESASGHGEGGHGEGEHSVSSFHHFTLTFLIVNLIFLIFNN